VRFSLSLTAPFSVCLRIRSAVTQGYFRDAFLHLVVDKPSRRIPLVGGDALRRCCAKAMRLTLFLVHAQIHRGYYLRHVAITHHVEAFLAQRTLRVGPVVLVKGIHAVRLVLQMPARP
jgi:hypothetical protein